MLEIDGMCKELNIPVSGADPKVWVHLLGSNYLVKWGKPGNNLAPYSEYVASRFMEKAGLDVQFVELVIYNGRVCALCRDIGKVKQLIDINESSLDSGFELGYYTLEDMYKRIQCMRKLTDLQKKELWVNFKRVFLVDAILANRDRHAGNWAYRVDGSVAPIYDNSASLYPSIIAYSESNMKRLFRRLTIEEPKSAVQRARIDGVPRKHNFYYLLQNEAYLEEELHWVKKFDIKGFIDYSVSGIPKVLANFYRILITLRFDCIIRRIDFNVDYERLSKDGLTPTQSVQDFIQQLSNL